ncbi:MAG TPA: hypothetical protein VNZ26_14960 [Vicinamibacterales bacterium]|nr:hypothetical protein [Vicinamibacterales bacterium]
MDPLDFLTIARTFSASAIEAERRMSIGRSYYALFNHLRGHLELYKPFAKDDEDHQRAVHYLTGANNTDLKAVGQWLRDLRTQRNTADYDMSTAVDDNACQLALQRADRALAKFSGVPAGLFEALVKAQVTYRSTRRA